MPGNISGEFPPDISELEWPYKLSSTFFNQDEYDLIVEAVVKGYQVNGKSMSVTGREKCACMIDSPIRGGAFDPIDNEITPVSKERFEIVSGEFSMRGNPKLRSNRVLEPQSSSGVILYRRKIQEAATNLCMYVFHSDSIDVSSASTINQNSFTRKWFIDWLDEDNHFVIEHSHGAIPWYDTSIQYHIDGSSCDPPPEVDDEHPFMFSEIEIYSVNNGVKSLLKSHKFYVHIKEPLTDIEPEYNNGLRAFVFMQQIEENRFRVGCIILDNASFMFEENLEMHVYGEEFRYLVSRPRMDPSVYIGNHPAVKPCDLGYESGYSAPQFHMLFSETNYNHGGDRIGFGVDGATPASGFMAPATTRISTASCAKTFLKKLENESHARPIILNNIHQYTGAFLNTQDGFFKHVNLDLIELERGDEINIRPLQTTGPGHIFQLLYDPSAVEPEICNPAPLTRSQWSIYTDRDSYSIEIFGVEEGNFKAHPSNESCENYQQLNDTFLFEYNQETGVWSFDQPVGCILRMTFLPLILNFNKLNPPRAGMILTFIPNPSLLYTGVMNMQMRVLADLTHDETRPWNSRHSDMIEAQGFPDPDRLYYPRANGSIPYTWPEDLGQRRADFRFGFGSDFNLSGAPLNLDNAGFNVEPV